MPLSKDMSISDMMSEMSQSYKEKGTIGNSRPKSKKKAMKQMLAIAYSKKRGK